MKSAESSNEQTGASDGTAPAVGLWASIAVLFRRWPLVLLGGLITGLMMFAVLKLVPVSYSATGSLLLDIPDDQAATPGSSVPQNPILGTRGYIGDLVITIMADPEAEDQVLARGGTGKYETSLGIGEAALVQLSATGKTAEEAMTTWHAAADATSARLVELQKAKGAADSQLVRINPLTAPVDATKQAGSRTRALVAAGVLGMGFTLVLVFGVESLSQYRRSRREGIGAEVRDEWDGSGDGGDADGPSRLELRLASERPGRTQPLASREITTFPPPMVNEG